MNNQARDFFAILSIFCLVTLSGCEFLGLTAPKKKPVKAAPKTEQVAATPVESQEPKALDKNTLARIGAWSMSLEEFNDRLKILKQGLPDFDEKNANSKRLVLDELIRQQLLVQDAERSDIPDQKEIKDAVEDFRKTLYVQELANRLTKDVAVTEEDAQKYYTENKDVFVDPIKWKVSEIVVADEAAAKNLLVQVLQGADFAETAKANSRGKTAASGGQLTEFAKAPFEAMQVAIANLSANGVSSAFKGPDGFYIVKVDSRSGGEAKAFADVKKDLIAGLTMRKQQQAVVEHLNTLAEKTKIDINQELLGTITAEQ